jgi:hypothetical protein
MRVKAAIVSLLVLLVFIVSSCAPAERQTYKRLKCPNCGYDWSERERS